MIDHTVLRPETTAAEAVAAYELGVRLGTFAVCLSPSLASAVRPLLGPGRPVLACVIGFPSGAHSPSIKAAEAALAVAEGASELDMVVDLGAVFDDRFEDVEAEVRAVRSSVGQDVVLKVIVEAGAIGSRLVPTCRAACEGGADMVKTSTGFHPAGGATVDAVRAMVEAVAGRRRPIGVKASGGIRTTAAAQAMVAAGATRIGASATEAILAG